MKGHKDHGRYSNLAHTKYVAEQKARRSDPRDSGVPGSDGGRERRNQGKRRGR